MPHLLIERIRVWPAWLQCPCKWTRSDATCAYVVEVLDILGSIIFVVGSACFLPYYKHDIEAFLWGCFLFALGSVVFLGLSMFTLMEAVRDKGGSSLEAFENLLYVLGSFIFVVGTILYWPERPSDFNLRWIQNMSLGSYFNLFSPEFEGTLLFILGSVVFGAAAFANALNQKDLDSVEGKMLTATTSAYMVGSMLFVMGSVAFLPELGCSDQMAAIGSWFFLIGSFLYVVGGAISLVRTNRKLRNPENAKLAESSDAGA